MWVLFNPGTVGSSASGTLEVSVTETGGTFSVPIEANVIAKPTVASSMGLDRSGSMGAPSGVAGLKRIEVLRNSAPLFVHLLGDDAVASVLDCFRDFDQELPPDVVLGYIRLAKATVAAEMRLVRSLPPGVIPARRTGGGLPGETLHRPTQSGQGGLVGRSQAIGHVRPVDDSPRTRPGRSMRSG
ncbi:hypothetical protein AB0392_15725 [Nonomuraea angiospora]|uniref:hypothetical protein n=1 Tax=Nonomuraea angiospora TaxID=46172 RepID=UPI00344B7C44